MKDYQKESLFLLFFPHEVLRLRSEIFSFCDDNCDIANLEKKMINIMSQRNGVGLAAPQVGLAKRFFIVRLEGSSSVSLFINPKITAYSEESKIDQEGCLSIPNIYASVKRSTFIELEYFDKKQKFHKQEFEGFSARIIQHEFDHLEGKLFIDYLTPSLKRKLLKDYFSYRKTKKQR